MILTGENRRTRRKISPGPTVSTIDPMWTALRQSPVLRGEMPATNRRRSSYISEMRKRTQLVVGPRSKVQAHT